MGGPGHVVPDSIRPAEAGFEVASEGRGEVGEAKSNGDFAGDGSAVDEELTFGRSDQGGVRENDVVVL